MDKFWEAVSSKIAERWLAVSVPALVFWLGTLLAWARSHHGIHELTDWLSQQKTPVQLATVLVILLGVAGSGVVVALLVTPALRLLEGYWPTPLHWLRNLLITRVRRIANQELASWHELAEAVLPEDGSPTGAEVNKYARLDERLRRRPRTDTQLMPTRIGNILRAAETWPDDKYGLDTLTVWPRFWLVLPDPVRLELTQARSALDRAVAVALWGLLFCPLAPWTLLALPIGAATITIAVFLLVPSRACVYADLIEAAFDLHRTALYKQLRWPLPATPEDERPLGRSLTRYLRRGSTDQYPVFTPAKD